MTSTAHFGSLPLSESLKHGLRALAIADEQFEPFVDWVVDVGVLADLVTLGLAEAGPSSRPAVGELGYRLTDSGWDLFDDFWGFRSKGLQQTIVNA
jgi:hypothetical protein